MVLLAALALWAAYRRPPEVTLERERPASGFEGGRVPLGVRVRVRSALPARVVIEDPLPRTVVADAVPTASLTVFGVAEAELRTLLTLNRRGVHAWPGATLHWADPLGLFWRRVALPGRPPPLEVYPGTHGLRLPELLRPLLSEGSLSRTLGLDDPLSLRGVREYVAGDPPGRVHWRLSAHSGILTVRDPERTASSSLCVYLDPSHGGEVFMDSAVRLAASLLREAGDLGLPVSVASPVGATPAGRSPEHLRAALLALARLSPQAGEPPLIPPVRAGANLFVLTNRAGAALVTQAMRARAQASRVVIVALPEGFYLEPGESPRRQWVSAPDTVRDLERQAAALAGAGVLVYVLRGNQSVLRLA
ncbi:DUF58 domain-containing protein [Deinococcus sp. Leaf326]|uniref:DUF58 domain-containing protein n=1 Tax=Deinococcus sp. Leaf326 TaxID=1736338 RepID=UPI0009E69AF8|nr:DUF58 domain-containing protein [Deinococcus sp. Leaf326]